MALKYPDFIKVLAESKKEYHISLIDRVESKYGTNHTAVGDFLASSWNLPPNICQMI